jgi:hypothetical protein
MKPFYGRDSGRLFYTRFFELTTCNFQMTIEALGKEHFTRRVASEQATTTKRRVKEGEKSRQQERKEKEQAREREREP